MKFNEQGRSMIEMLGVLAIVGVLSVGGIAGYSKAMAKFNTNKAIDQVNMISTNIRTMFASQSNYAGLNIPTALKANLIPSELYTYSSTLSYTSATKISNPFGGSTAVLAAKNSNDNDSFIIAMDNIPQPACVAMATTEWGSEAGGGLVGLRIATGTAVANASSALGSSGNSSLFLTSEGAFPVSVASAVAACSKSNTFTWQYL